jgi:hypothetical protein
MAQTARTPHEMRMVASIVANVCAPIPCRVTRQTMCIVRDSVLVYQVVPTPTRRVVRALRVPLEHMAVSADTQRPWTSRNHVDSCAYFPPPLGFFFLCRDTPEFGELIKTFRMHASRTQKNF